jgi:hypothetical protein
MADIVIVAYCLDCDAELKEKDIKTHNCTGDN